MIKTHIMDGVALTKFIYWIKNINKKKKITEVQAQNKLEKFRKMNKNFLYPSFDTIAGSGKMEQLFTTGQIKKIVKLLKKDIFLCDLVVSINMELQMLPEQFVFQHKRKI